MKFCVDPAQVRTVARSSLRVTSNDQLVGCPKDQWNRRKKTCRVAEVVVGTINATGRCPRGLRTRIVQTGNPSNLGLAPPAPGHKVAPFDPWSPEETKRRLAQAFVDVKADQVKQLAPKELPAHVVPFAEYMAEKSKEPITGEDVAKAYLITVGSMRRAAIDKRKIQARWPEFEAATDKVRPEDVLGDLLRSPVGQRYLASAAKGQLDREAAEVIAKRFGAFGFEPTFAKQLETAPTLAADAPRINNILKKGSRKRWYDYVKGNVSGVSMAKAGFLASLLGRGDMATADARELIFWLCPPNEWNAERRNCRRPLAKIWDVDEIVNEDFMNIFNKRMRGLRMNLPDRYKPFREHLTHHALWDAVGGSQTTHQEIIETMKRG